VAPWVGGFLVAWKESWQLKLRRRLRKPFNKIVHGRRSFVTSYRGADFLLRPHGIGTLEISAKISEHQELTNFMRLCADIRPDAFVDIGANIGLYSCILLKNSSVPRAILFEPDRANLVQLKANLLINNIVDLAEIHEVAVGDVSGRNQLVPGAIDGGFSRIVDNADACGSYEIRVARLDDMLSFSGKTLAIKIDVESYEPKVLAGMKRTLKQNHAVIQIEAFETKDQVIATMAAAGYDLIGSFHPNFVFKN
jgi:FkbM family methyltransferase